MGRKWKQLSRKVVACDRCPRLIKHCRVVAEEKRRAFRDEAYWGKPVPNFGDPQAALLIIGLAPGAHGANRTGRMFTGDRSGDWLFKALHQAGFASQAKSVDLDDGLELINCAITNVGRCAPPGNKPTRQELQNCRDWFRETVDVLPATVYVALGRIAWNATIDLARDLGWIQVKRRPKFAHLAEVELGKKRTLIGSYHPSQQNTFTGRLTRRMFNRVFKRARKLIEE